MNELEVILPMPAIKSILKGNAIVLIIKDQQLKIVLRCQEESLREHIDKAMLAFLPTPPEVH
jgi:hypothetical protein